MDCLIKNGSLITSKNRVSASVGIKDGLISGLFEPGEEPPAKEVIDAAGLAILPGIIDMQTGLVRESPNLPDWVDYPARAAIEQCLKTVVILENDANVAALGEKWLGAAKDYDDMAMLTLGTGVGGGGGSDSLLSRCHSCLCHRK